MGRVREVWSSPDPVALLPGCPQTNSGTLKSFPDSFRFVPDQVLTPPGLLIEFLCRKPVRDVSGTSADGIAVLPVCGRNNPGLLRIIPDYSRGLSGFYMKRV